MLCFSFSLVILSADWGFYIANSFRFSSRYFVCFFLTCFWSFFLCCSYLSHILLEGGGWVCDQMQKDLLLLRWFRWARDVCMYHYTIQGILGWFLYVHVCSMLKLQIGSREDITGNYLIELVWWISSFSFNLRLVNSISGFLVNSTEIPPRFPETLHFVASC